MRRQLLFSIYAAAVAVFGTGVTLLLVAPAAAELPPQYTTWQDFAAVAGESSIPYVLGTVDHIERTQDGKYVVRAGACFVEITVNRESGVGPDGKIVVGLTRVSKVSVGEKHSSQ
jgi:hypothetical protein